MLLNIPISLVKELRDRTNVGVMECKQELINTNGNIQLAIDNMRKNGLIKAEKKSGRITKEGIILIKITKNKTHGIILEVNCETDFVSKNDEFKKFCNMLIHTALKKNITNLNTLQNEFKKEQSMLISILDENINIRRIAHIKGEIITSYLHNNKIGVIISISGSNSNEQLLKYIAMHIVANKPKYLDIHHIPTNIINHEKNIQMNIAIQSGKSHEIAEKITEGRVNKFINEISLMNQPFLMDTKQTIKNLLKGYNITINEFILFELGENIATIE